MSLARDILLQAQTALLETNGEPVLFRGETVNAIIDRTLPPEVVQRSELDLIQSEASEVWIMQTAIVYPPKIGEHFTDDIGLYHTIRAVRRDGVTWKLLCEVNERQ